MSDLTEATIDISDFLSELFSSSICLNLTESMSDSDCDASRMLLILVGLMSIYGVVLRSIWIVPCYFSSGTRSRAAFPSSASTFSRCSGIATLGFDSWLGSSWGSWSAE